MSTYIIDKDPNRFGGRQQDYADQVDLIVEETAEKIRIAVEGNQDLTELFYQILASVGEARNRIAVEHKTMKAEQFGIRRDAKETFLGILGVTPLCGPYDEYGKRFLSVIQKQLKTMKYTCEGFQETESTISFAKCMGRCSTMEISILTGEPLAKLREPFRESDYRNLCRLCGVEPQNGPSFRDRFISLTRNKDAMQKLKENFPEDYRRLRFFCFISIIDEKLFKGQPKSDWVLVTINSEVGGKLYPLSQFLTWIHYDGKTDPVDNMTNHSSMTHIYLDSFLVEPMLDDIAKIFKQVVKWNRENIEDLQNQIALFRNEFDPTMPFDRGSSAAAEIFERAMYRSFGMRVTYKPQKDVDLEAITSPLKTFVEGYDSMIQLEKIDPNPLSYYRMLAFC